jgi:hypothetical protein
MADNPYPLPETLSATLQRAFDYWDDLKRGGNNMPFWDDVKPSMLQDVADRLMLIDVYAEPERFRIRTVGADIGESSALRGKFLDEETLPGRLDYMLSQCSATVEARAPTFYTHAGAPPYARILLPMWGDGRISMLLGAVELG